VHAEIEAGKLTHVWLAVAAPAPAPGANLGTKGALRRQEPGLGAHGWADGHTAAPQAAATHQHGEWQARPQARGNASSPSSKALDACLIKSSRSRSLGPS
jgi:hypothetical protein